ncbi:MAG: hypothetical protein PHI63_03700 [Patescibacteria group bacterium]|nr:hypothetical protein [Patescibacteria group bacterium]
MGTPSAAQSFPAPRPQLPSGRSLLRWALSFYGARWQLLAGIAVVPLIFTVLQILLSSPALRGLNIILGILALVASCVTSIALLKVVAGESTAGTAEGVPGVYQRLMPLFWPLAVISFFTCLAVVGSVSLFLLPVVLVGPSLLFAGYVFVVEHQRGMAALERSWYYARGYVANVFWRVVFFGIVTSVIPLLFISMVGVSYGLIHPTSLSSAQDGTALPLPFQIIFAFFQYLVIVPLSVIFLYGIYKALKQIKTVQPSPDELQKIRKTISIFMAIGVVGFVVLLLWVGSALLSAVNG